MPVERVEAAIAELPAERRFADLAAGERRRPELVGTDVGTLKGFHGDAPITASAR